MDWWVYRYSVRILLCDTSTLPCVTDLLRLSCDQVGVLWCVPSPSNHNWISLITVLPRALDSLHVAFSTHAMYHYLVDSFGDPDGIYRIIWYVKIIVRFCEPHWFLFVGVSRYYCRLSCTLIRINVISIFSFIYYSNVRPPIIFQYLKLIGLSRWLSSLASRRMFMNCSPSSLLTVWCTVYMLSASGNVRSFSFQLLKHTKLTPPQVGRHFGKILPWFVVGALHILDRLSLKTSSRSWLSQSPSVSTLSIAWPALFTIHKGTGVCKLYFIF